MRRFFIPLPGRLQRARAFALAFLFTLFVASLHQGAVPILIGEASAVAGEPDLLPTRPDAPTHYPSMKALIDQSPHDTAVVLYMIEEGSSLRSQAESDALTSLANFLLYANTRNIRVISINELRRGAQRLAPEQMLPTEIDSAGVVSEFIAIRPSNRQRQLTQDFRGQTLIERHLAGIRNIIWVNRDYDDTVPTFEAIWHRINVYRNALLDNAAQQGMLSDVMQSYFKRLDTWPRWSGLPGWTLPQPLANDPHLHSVPIGEGIPGVQSRRTWSRDEWHTVYSEEGVLIPGIYDPADAPRSFMGAMADQNQFDAQIRVVLTERFYEETLFAHQANAQRSALLGLSQAALDDFARTTAGRSEADTIAILERHPLLAESKGAALPATLLPVLATGLVELEVVAHGGTNAAGGYDLSPLRPVQLGALLLRHPALGLTTSLNAGAPPRIAHLRMSACGVRCTPGYRPGTAPGIAADEIAYAQQLVRMLGRHGVQVSRVSLSNASQVLMRGPTQPLSSWFDVVDNEGRTVARGHESRLLTVAYDYDWDTDTFHENPDFDASQWLVATDEAVVPIARYADTLAASTTGGRIPDDVATDVGPAGTSHAGTARRTASGAVLDVRPAAGLRPRLETPAHTANDVWMAVGAHGRGTTIVTADMSAVAASMRSEPGGVIIVDTDPARASGVRMALRMARRSPDVAAWIARLRASDLADAVPGVLDWLHASRFVAGPRPNDAVLLADPIIAARYAKLRERLAAGTIRLGSADLATVHGAATINALLGRDPVALMMLPAEEYYLREGTRLGSRASRGAFLMQLRQSFALLMGPETVLSQSMSGGSRLWLKGEQALRNHWQLPTADAVVTTAASGTGAIITGPARDGDVWAKLHELLDNDPRARDADRKFVRDAESSWLLGKTSVSRWWNRLRTRFAELDEWVAQHFREMLASVGIHVSALPDLASSPAVAARAHANDPLVQRVEGEQLGRALVAGTDAALAAASLARGEWMPVLASVRPSDPGPPCTRAACAPVEAEREYTMQWVHAATGEERELRTRDPVFAEVRDFMARQQARLRPMPGLPAADAHVNSMNAAFAIMGLMHLLDNQRQGDATPGLPDNLATALQVQMYVGQVQASAAVLSDAGKLMTLVREGLQASEQAAMQAGETATLATKMFVAMRAFGMVLDGVMAVASTGLLGLDIYNLAHAQTDAQRAVFGAQTAVDGSMLLVFSGAMAAEAAGATAASSVLGSVAVPAMGLGIGIVGLVQAFNAEAADVDAAAAKFDRFADLYPRPAWTRAEEQQDVDGAAGAPARRSAFRFDAASKTLQPVHGIAVERIDLRTRDGSGVRRAHMAENFIDRVRPGSLGSSATVHSTRTVSGANHPVGWPEGARIPILARTGLYPSSALPLAANEVVDTLVLPATPASRFHGYTYQNLPGANVRHLVLGGAGWEAQPGFMGYDVLRRLESANWNDGVFLFDFDFNTIETILRTVREEHLRTRVDVVLDESVRLLALPEFVVPADTPWTPAQQAAYRQANAAMTAKMSYRVSPGARTAPVTIALQDGYGGFELQAGATGTTALWVLDARHLVHGDDIDVSVVDRTDGRVGQEGMVQIAGMPVRVAGAAGTPAQPGEGAAQVYVVLPHGVWRVDFAQRVLVSTDVLAATDLVHDGHVQEGLKRRGFAWRSDGFIEMQGDAQRRFPIGGAQVTRYYQSVRDATLRHALTDRYPNARLVFGDAVEALFHDPDSGILHRVQRGSAQSQGGYLVGARLPSAPSTPAPHTIKRVDRLDAQTLLVMVEYPRLTPAYLAGAQQSAQQVADRTDGVTAVYELRPDALRLVGVLGHHALTAYLEEVDRATPTDATYGDFLRWFSTLAKVNPVATGVANELTPIAPAPAEWVAVRGELMVQDSNASSRAMPRQHWIRARDGHLLKPLWPATDAGCAVDGFKVRHAVPSPGCTQVHPGDAVLLGTFTGPGSEHASAPQTTWLRFHSPGRKAFYGVRPYAPELPITQYPRTEVHAAQSDDGGAQAADGLQWRYTRDGKTLAGIGATWLSAHADWATAVPTLVDAQPADALPATLPVSGLQDAAGAPLQAWFVTAGTGTWTLAPNGTQLVRIAPELRVAFVRDAAGALWQVPLVDADRIASVFDGRRLRAALQAKLLDAPGIGGDVVSATPRSDAVCEGVFAVYDNGAAVCHAGTGRAQLREWRACGSAVPPASLLAGFDHEYIALTCDVEGQVTRSGWVSPEGERIAPPTALASKTHSDYRVLGFNREAREAYFFDPAAELLYVSDWTGKSVRRTWLRDAQLIGSALSLQLPRTGVPAAQIPRIDGIRSLGLGSASRRAATYAIDGALWMHYPRIVVDLGGAPVGEYQHYAVHLDFAGASQLEVKRWPGGWVAREARTGRHLEMRGRGGQKSLRFGDAQQILDLATVSPVRFDELPEGFTDPGEALPFSDQHDIDGDGVADLAWLVAEGTQHRVHWQLRAADGALAGPPVRSNMSVIAGSPEWARGFHLAEGTTQYCGVTPLGSHPSDVRVACYAIDARGVRDGCAMHSFGASWTGAAPLKGEDLSPWAEGLARRVRFWSWDADASGDGRLVRFNGQEPECLSGGTACVTMPLPHINLHLALAPRSCSALAAGGSAPAWCARVQATIDPAHIVGPWQNGSGNWVFRINEGDVECASYDGTNCLGSSVAIANLDPARLKPLACGVPHTLAWGSPGYGQANHWCERYRPNKPTTGSTTGHAPSVQDLRISGTFAVGAVLRGEYTFVDADGDREGDSRYQWYVSDPVTGAPVVVTGAKQRTYTIRPEDRGANRKIWFNVERLASATGTPRESTNMPVDASRIGLVAGHAPTATQVAIDGIAQAGQTLRGRFAYADAENDAPGAHEYRWYRALSPAATRTLIAQTATPAYTMQQADVGHVLWFEVVPRSLATGEAAGTPALSAPTAVVVVDAPRYENNTVVALPDNSTPIETRIMVNETGTIETLRVKVKILHPWVSQLEVDLLSPYGELFRLHEREYGPANLDKEYVLVNGATGRPHYGFWTLRVRDHYGTGDGGRLEGWSMQFH